MRLLFVTGGSPATVFPLTPLATAARNAGHEVIVASNEETMEAVTGAGLPGTVVSRVPIRQHITCDRAGQVLPVPSDPQEHMRYIGHGFGRMAADYLEPLTDLARAWRPDVVVCGMLTFAGPLVAARLGVPCVRHSWDSGEPPVVDVTAAEELAPELERLGLAGIPDPDLWIDICPPSVRPPDAADAQPMRYVPSNLQRPVEPWMLGTPGTRRVCVTAGTKVAPGYFYDYLVELAEKAKELDAELLVAAPAEVADELTARLGVKAGWLPLDVVARNCDLLIHHAGGGTALTGMACAVPQLLIPNMPKLVPPSRRLVDYGAARILEAGEDTPEAIAEAARDLLTDGSYRERARDLAREMAAMPSPPEVLGVVEKLP
ncbi:nucleotide disphospho-sugar-binding domain-containing protein [Streptomyces albidus (ex Kaewkla and Franco 2022)]|uniref:nucleotide disphospho-sugar-binding domain-containing protein n=1 Tax=Streptomyces albidus (ex Kaewkla and Franco 2022) TaxID=722709 RepID=UPI0015EF666A|nr:nucleotide disphospho-sugar-binding domain-containing protein [Streptomyces albidus (ex Kaewkla and Franco 2022)]